MMTLKVSGLLVVLSFVCLTFFIATLPSLGSNSESSNSKSSLRLARSASYPDLQIEIVPQSKESLDIEEKEEDSLKYPDSSTDTKVIIGITPHSNPVVFTGNGLGTSPENSWQEKCMISLPERDSQKHIVPPPAGPAHLVCCNTTVGVLNIQVHPSWAPYGAQRFLDLVDTGFFSAAPVPLFRALRNFIVQFGLSGSPEVQAYWNKKENLPDDPQWLPPGPSGRQINGRKRFPFGYLSYAGGGPNTRGNQLFVTLDDNEYLGGGSPWEVPWGMVVGEESLAVLRSIYTGYGDAPSQGAIHNRGMAYVNAEFPLLDAVTACVTVARDLPWTYHDN